MPKYEITTDQGTFEVETDSEVTNFDDLDLSGLIGSGYSNTRPVTDLNSAEGIDPESPFHPDYKDKSFWNEAYSAGNALVEGAASLLDSPIFGVPAQASFFEEPATRAVVQAEIDKAKLSNMALAAAKAGGVLGEETANTGIGQVAEEVARALPMAPAGGVGSLLLSGAGSGIAKANDFGPVGQLIGAIAAPLAGAGIKAAGTKGKDLFSSLFSSATKEENARQAAKELLGRIADPEAAIASLEKAAAEEAATPWIVKQSDTYLPQYRRTAEVTGQRGLSSLESVMEKTGLKGDVNSVATVVAEQDLAREVARDRLIERVIGEPMRSSERGAIVRSGLVEANAEIADKVRDLAAKAFPEGSEISTPMIKAALTSKLNTTNKSGAREFSPAFELAVEKFKTLPKKVDLETLQEFRSIFGSFSSPGAMAAPEAKMQAKIAASLRGALDKAVNRAVASGDVPKARANAWRKMIETRAKQGELFQSKAVGKVLEKEDFNQGFKIADEDVAGKILSTKEEATRAMEALKMKSSSAQQLRASLISDIWDRSWNSTEGKLNGRSFIKNLRSYVNVAPEVLTKQQRKVLETIADDVQSQTRAVSKSFSATKRNSATPEQLTQIEALQRAIKDTYMSGVRQKIANSGTVGSIANAMFEVFSSSTQAQDRLNRVLAKFALNPNYATELLKSPTRVSPKVMGELVKELNRSIPGFGFAFTGKSQEGSLVPAPYAELFSSDKGIGNRGEEELSLFTPSGMREQMDTPKADNKLVKAVVWQESRGKPNAVSGKGATGLMQVMPATAKEIAKELGVKEYDLKDPETNMQFGQHYLNKMLKLFGGDEALALAAYNAGPGKVREWINKWGADWETISAKLKEQGVYKETRDYVPSILRKRSEIIEA